MNGLMSHNACRRSWFHDHVAWLEDARAFGEVGEVGEVVVIGEFVAQCRAW
jgi:hypothetical protein